MLSRVFVVRNQ